AVDRGHGRRSVGLPAEGPGPWPRSRAPRPRDVRRPRGSGVALLRAPGERRRGASEAAERPRARRLRRRADVLLRRREARAPPRARPAGAPPGGLLER